MIDINTYQFLYLCAAVLSLIFWRTNRKYLSVFLWFSVVFELVLSPLCNGQLGTNHPAFNIYAFVCTSYYFFYFLVDFKLSLYRKALLASFTVFVLFAVWNISFGQGLYHINNHTYVLGMAVVMITIVMHIVQVMVNSSERILRQRSFWLAVGIILFYTADFQFLLFLQDILAQSENFFDPLYNLVIVGNHFLALGYCMVVLCPVMFAKAESISLTNNL
jgi:hypothetical protein